MDPLAILHSIFGKKKLVSPIPQDQMLTDPGNMAKSQIQSQYNGWDQPIQQALQLLNPENAPQQQAQDGATPAPTPFGKNVLDGFVIDTPKQYTGMISDAAKQNNVPTSLLSSLIKHESGFNPNAKSPAGALGIAQFMPDTAKGRGVDPLDPKSAIMGAAKYLRDNYDQFNQRPDLALAAYNAGAGAVQKYKGIPPFQETQNYVKNIMNDANTTYGGQ